MKKISYGMLLLFACLLICDCSAKYSLRTSQSERPLQWPFAPAKPKITFVQAMNGFARGAGAGSVFRAITGSNHKESDMFLLPVGVAAGRDGRIAVADAGRRCVHLFIPAKQQYMRLLGSDKQKVVSPIGVVFDDDLNLYLSDSTGKLYIFSSNGAFRQVVQKADNAPLQRPTGLAYNSANKLVYVVDTLANKIYAFNADGKAMFSFGQRGEGQGTFNYPTHIFCAAGSLYVTDSLNFRIQIFNESGKYIGSFGHHGDGSGDMAMPKGIAADKSGVVYVVDSLFDNVQLFDRTGTFLLTIGGRGTELGEFWLPSGLFIDGSTLYVCDTYNHRVQVFQINEQYS